MHPFFINDGFCSKDVCVGSDHHHHFCDGTYLFYQVGFEIWLWFSSFAWPSSLVSMFQPILCPCS